MKQLSVTEYANSIGITRQAVLAQIKDKRLPEGVSAQKIGNSYLVTVKEGVGERK